MNGFYLRRGVFTGYVSMNPLVWNQLLTQFVSRSGSLWQRGDSLCRLFYILLEISGIKALI